MVVSVCEAPVAAKARASSHLRRATRRPCPASRVPKIAILAKTSAMPAAPHALTVSPQMPTEAANGTTIADWEIAQEAPLCPRPIE
jgi:hypothetical protein